MKRAALASVAASVQKAEPRYNPVESEGINCIVKQQVNMFLILYLCTCSNCLYFLPLQVTIFSSALPSQPFNARN
jgi:hypothetical protein